MRWYPSSRLFLADIPASLSAWLLDPGSLTQRLRRVCTGRFRVQVLNQSWQRPSQDEARVLKLRWDTRTWIREVQLLCDDQPWVFARTLIPPSTLRGRGRRLTTLGTRPLGAVLFADPRVQRGPVEIARITTGQPLHRRAFPHTIEPPNVIWGRRSVFRINGDPLLVSEIFLPGLPSPPTVPARTYSSHDS